MTCSPLTENNTAAGSATKLGASCTSLSTAKARFADHIGSTLRRSKQFRGSLECANAQLCFHHLQANHVCGLAHGLHTSQVLIVKTPCRSHRQALFSGRPDDAHIFRAIATRARLLAARLPPLACVCEAHLAARTFNVRAPSAVSSAATLLDHSPSTTAL